MNAPVEFEGQCAFALSTGKKGVDGSEKISLEQEGKTYYFSNSFARLLWKVLPGRREKAESTFSS